MILLVRRHFRLSKLGLAPGTLRFLSHGFGSDAMGSTGKPEIDPPPPPLMPQATSKTPHYLNPLKRFKAAFGAISELPYCTGTVPFDESTATLFYRTGIQNKAESLNFAHPPNAQLSTLSETCQQATFGLNQNDVLDESYRKAGKLDATDISTQFSPLASGIIDTIRQSLLQAEHADKSIKVELYKLNVYGPGSFFKAHVDTPRSDTMFGSLVVVLPAAHEGGSLVFRHRDQEHTVDTARAVTIQKSPHAAFVAFFSDVEHEVSMVTSGYRVTLTYNLYFVDQPPAPKATLDIKPAKQSLAQIKTTLSALLADPEFLPKGGFLGFGLSHKYPFNPSSTELSQLEKHLKGSDAYVRRICKALSLDVSLRTVFRYPFHEDLCLFDHFTNPEGSYFEDIFYYHKEEERGTYVYDLGRHSKHEDALPIAWVKPLSESNSFHQEFIVYGNEPCIGCTYGEVCLVAKIGTPEERCSA